MDPTRVTTTTATSIDTPSIQSVLGSSLRVHPNTIETTAETIRIRSIISSNASRTYVQKGGTGSTNTLLEPNSSSRFLISSTPL